MFTVENYEIKMNLSSLQCSKSESAASLLLFLTLVSIKKEKYFAIVSLWDH